MSIARKIRKRVQRVPADLAFQACGLPILKRALDAAHSDAAERHRVSLPPLADDKAGIVSDLIEKGVHITSIDKFDLQGTDKMLASARALHAEYDRRAERGPECFANPNAIQASRAEMIERPELFYWGLNDELISIVEHYISVPVAYDGLNFFYTLARSEEKGARRWHRDQEDIRMVKIALYLHDVGANDGPLQVLRRNGGQQAAWPLVMTQNQIEQAHGSALTEEDIMTCEGPAGTLVFCDTAQHYHRGKPANSRNRCVIYFNYCSRRPRYPFFCERSVFSRHEIRMLASSLQDKQRDCVLWRDTLNPFMRLIPAAPISN